MFATRWKFWGSALTLVGATLLTGHFIRDSSAAQEGPGGGQRSPTPSSGPTVRTMELRGPSDTEAKAYYIMEAGRVREFGVALSPGALYGLPEGGHHDWNPEEDFFEHLLPLPTGNPTPIQLVELDWNHRGHEPPGVYDVAHYDIHIYTIPLEERNAIDPADPSYRARAAKLSPPDQLPLGVVAAHELVGVEPAVAAVPRMGVHWLNPGSPELNGAPFTHTFISGSWDGRTIFFEPMASRDLLESETDLDEALSQLPGADLPGGYRIYWTEDRRERRVTLTHRAG